MPITQVISAFNTPPQTTDPANFDARADVLFGTDLPLMVTEQNLWATQANALETNVNAKEATAVSAANVAAAAAAQAVAGINAPVWASGSYATDAVVRSPTNYLAYIRLAPGGADATDPAADNGTKWKAIPLELPIVVVTGTTHTVAVGTHVVMKNVAASTVTVPATLVSGDSFRITFENALTTNNILRNGHLIKGVAQDIAVDIAKLTVQLRYENPAYGLFNV